MTNLTLPHQTLSQLTSFRPNRVRSTGPDLGNGKGAWPQASHHRGASHQTAHILFLANESADDFLIDVLLQFAGVTRMY